jgi:hypothetical protein
MTSYFVCQGNDAKQLQAAVNAAIKDGWQPLGGVAISTDVKWISSKYGGGVIDAERQLFCQAVTK